VNLQLDHFSDFIKINIFVFLLGVINFFVWYMFLCVYVYVCLIFFLSLWVCVGGTKQKKKSTLTLRHETASPLLGRGCYQNSFQKQNLFFPWAISFFLFVFSSKKKTNEKKKETLRPVLGQRFQSLRKKFVYGIVFATSATVLGCRNQALFFFFSSHSISLHTQKRYYCTHKYIHIYNSYYTIIYKIP